MDFGSWRDRYMGGFTGTSTCSGTRLYTVSHFFMAKIHFEFDKKKSYASTAKASRGREGRN